MKKILIIEDDQIVANIYRNRFATEGYQVEVALDGFHGLEMLQKFNPDAIILDLMLPKLSGVELMKKVRAEAKFQKLPIIVFSNTYLTNLVQDAWKAGATKCLSKASCSPKMLVDVVRSTLASNGIQDAAPGQPLSSPSSGKTAGARDKDVEDEARLQKSLADTIPATLTTLRSLLQSAIKAEKEEDRLKRFQEMYRSIHSLTGNAGVSGLLPLAQMCDALEALVKELHAKPKHINASTLRTLATSIDFLGLLNERLAVLERKPSPASILVVDDEAISRRAITYALEKAKLKSVNVEDPLVAYDLLTNRAFDLIFLDVDMPGMNGYELCSRIRNLPSHKQTPVVFVTGLTDLESRANSMVSGGNDFIAKPFLFIELAVKALMYILRRRLNASK